MTAELLSHRRQSLVGGRLPSLRGEAREEGRSEHRGRDAEVHRGPDGRPHFEVRGTVDARVQALGITSIHVSLSHDAGIASAVVVAEGD